MAGGKETPRQKMIGMMYLVLTALLALQVSSAVLEKFAIVNETLTQLVSDDNKSNAQALASIMDESGKSTESKIKSAVDRAQKVRSITTEMITYLDNLKEQMIKASEQPKINESLINDHSSKVAAIMIDKVHSKVGVEFEAKLDSYVKDLNALLPEMPFTTLAKAPKDLPLFANDENNKNKDFLTFTFENTPAIAGITSITQIQTQVLGYENKALSKLAEEAGAKIVRVETIIPMVRPVSSVVAAGSTYQADMFISASSSAFDPQMAVDGKPIPVENDPSGIKMGRVKFVASGGNYDKDGFAKKSFLAEIKLNDSTYKQNIEYTVAKPVIRITTGTLPTLYMSACNPVNIEVPALGSAYNPNITAKGGNVIKGDKPGSVVIVPTQRKVTVSVSNAGTFIGDEDFDVKPIPLPRLIANDNNNRPIDVKDGVKAGTIAGLRIAAVPDEGFKEFAPKDANYRIREMEVILARGTQRVQTINATSEIVDLSQWRSQMRPGDRIAIDVKKIVRFPCSGSPEDVPLEDVINIPIQ